MDEESARIEHLKLIQAIVDRMARNSSAVKAGTVTIGAALVAVTFSSTYLVAAFGVPLILMLWVIDAFFLRQERAFRNLYDVVRTNAPPAFSSLEYFTMAAEPNSQGRIRVTWAAMRASTMILFYLVMAGFLVLVGALEVAIL